MNQQAGAAPQAQPWGSHDTQHTKGMLWLPSLRSISLIQLRDWQTLSDLLCARLDFQGSVFWPHKEAPTDKSARMTAYFSPT